MKLASFFAVSSAMLAMASPVQKRAATTEFVLEWVTVTVTAGDESSTPTSSSLNHPPVESPIHHKPPFHQPPPAPVIEPQPTSVEPAPTVVEPPPTTVEPPTTTDQPITPSEPTTTDIPPPPPGGDDGSLGAFQLGALKGHNVHRANHSSPDLNWDDTLASYAAQSAESCIFKHDNAPGDGNYGQNIAMTGSSGDNSDDDTGKLIQNAASDMWYNGEAAAFAALLGKNSPDMSNFHAWGHYTQVIWKGSESVGCAVKYCPKGTMNDVYNSWYMVCNYSPGGNVVDHYAENVGFPLGLPAF